MQLHKSTPSTRLSGGRVRGVRPAARPLKVQNAIPLKVMISGAPAAGKGTQCEKIVDRYNLIHISVGDILREEVKNGTAAGTKAKDFMDKGML
ncbi:adenylate kinase-domain-containing protein, partial [Dunaliella salina]